MRPQERTGAPPAPSTAACRPAAVILLPVLLFLAVSCPSPVGPGLRGGILATFDVRGERFSVFITNARTIAQVLSLYNGSSSGKIPSGRVRKGPMFYNRPWSWHIDSEDITMAYAAVALCDGTPSYLEAHLDDWIASVGYFCPWTARLLSVKDFR